MPRFQSSVSQSYVLLPDKEKTKLLRTNSETFFQFEIRTAKQIKNTSQRCIILGKTCPHAQHHPVLQNKAKGQKLVGQRGMCIERTCGATFWVSVLPFGVADPLTAKYHDILARMHHNHSTTLPLTS